MRGGETEVFEGKTLSSLLEDIYNISREKRKDIKGIIVELSKSLTTPSDIAIIAPIIQQFLEVSVKNDEQLTKIATIVQRVISADAYQKGPGDPTEMLTEAEKEQLLRNATEELNKAKQEIQNELKEIEKLPRLVKN